MSLNIDWLVDSGDVPGLAGDAPLGTASDTKQSAEDVSAVDAGNDVSMWGLDDFSLSDVLGPDGDPMGETSLDSFMDLSAYLMEVICCFFSYLSLSFSFIPSQYYTLFCSFLEISCLSMYISSVLSVF